MAGGRDRRDGRVSQWGPASSQHASPPPPVASPHAGPNPLISDAGAGARLRRALGGSALWAWIAGAAVVIGGAVGLALTVDSDDDAAPEAPSVADADPTPADEPVAEPLDDLAEEPVDDLAEEPVDEPAAAETPDATTPADTPSAPTATTGDVFEYEDRDGSTWDVSITGLVEAGAAEGSGRCLISIGVLTPTSTDGAVSSSFSAPSIGLEFGGQIVDDSVNECDTTALEDAGYGWILSAAVTAGTPYPFFAEFPVDAAGVAPDAIRVGDLFDDTATSLTPVVLDDVPPAPRAVGERADVERQPMGGTAAAQTTYIDFEGAVWDVAVTGLVEVAPRIADTGRCLLVVGVMTPTTIDGALSDRFTTPPFGLVVDGRLVDSSAIECDDEGASAAGYGWRLRAEVAEGTPYPFYAEFPLPADAEVVDLLIVGLPADADAAWYEPTLLDDFPVIG